MLQPITTWAAPAPSGPLAWPLYGSASTRHIEQAALGLRPSPSLMQRAGQACAQLARALAPHARQAWVLCGPGHNGGDGLVAAAHLAAHGWAVTVTWLGQEQGASHDILQALQQARHSPLRWSQEPPHLGPQDIIIDALLGLGLRAGAANPRITTLLQHCHASPAHYLAVDLPSGLDADSGQWLADYAPAAGAGALPHASRHTLSLLTLKPGLFTAQGRDAAGPVWLDDLGLPALALPLPPPDAWLAGPPPPRALRSHASHKGSAGDVLVLGGQGLHHGAAMGGAALLAAMAALHQGAGRVFLHLLDEGYTQLLATQPEIMLRSQPHALGQLPHSTVVCGCGGGQAIAALLPKVLEGSARLVLDADALNAIAAQPMLGQYLLQRSQQQRPTLLTPHPLEAARLLGSTVADVQANRLAAAQQLSARWGCTVVLKGSGSIIASPGHAPTINPTGNARLATGGTGDVLAGMLGACWAAASTASGADLHNIACHATWWHGQHADAWPAAKPLTASALAQAL